MSRIRRSVKWSLIVVATTLAVVLGLLIFLTETHSGQKHVLEKVLERLEGTIDGRITVEDIRSEGLARGAVLYGVRVTSPEDEPFFYADSVLLRYSARTFISGDVVFSRVEVWNPDVVIEKMPGEERFNADRIFRTEPGEDPEVDEPARLVLFRDVGIHSGTVLVRYPASDPAPARAILEPGPGGDALVRRLEFEDISAFLPEAVISSPEIEGPVVEVGALSLDGRIYEDPFRVTGMQGVVRWAESRLVVQADMVTLPESRFSGRVVADFSADEGVGLVVDLQSPHVALRELQWLDPRLPAGEGRLDVELQLNPEQTRWDFRELDVAIEESRVSGSGVVITRGGAPTFEGMRLDLSPLALRRVEAWLPESFPKRGLVRGNLTLDGSRDRLRSEGRLTLDLPDAAPTTVRYAGIFHLDEPFGFTGLEATADPLDYAVVRHFLPEFRLTGPGRARVEATGRLGQGIRFTADLVHRPRDLEDSRVAVSGRVREGRAGLVLDLDGDLQPLNFTALNRAWPQFPLTGVVSGQVRAEGPLTDLRLTTDLDTPAGELDVVARLNVRDPAAGYFIEGDVAGFRLSEILPDLPDPTILTGYVRVEGRGTTLATLEADAVFRLRDSRLGELDVDTARLAVRATSGRLRIDTLDVRLAGLSLEGEGDLALTGAEPAGELSLRFASDSLGRFRPLLLGRNVVTRDDLNRLDRLVLRGEGIDPDTLPLAEEIEMSGAVRGEVVLRGSVSDFSAEGEAAFERLQYGPNFIENAQVEFAAERLPGLEGNFRVDLVADSVRIAGRRYAGAELEVDYRAPAGTARIQLIRDEAEDYRARASFRVDTIGGEVLLEELAFRFDETTWILEDSAVVAWTGDGVRVEGLVIGREGEEDGLRIVADGFIPREGPADFRLQVDDLRLDRLARLIQVDTVPVEGEIALDLRVTGTAAAPEVVGTLEADAVRYGDIRFDRVGGDVQYRADRLTLDIDAWREEALVLELEGYVPMELSLRPLHASMPEESMDLHVTADSLPAEVALGTIGALRDVEGLVTGTFHLHGSPHDVSPSGTLQMDRGAFTLPAAGVRYREVTGTLTLEPDGRVDVDATARAGGLARISGSMRVDTLHNPLFDLNIALDDFRAVQRRDVEGTVDGVLHLGGSYGQPVLTGDLRVLEGVLQIEEFRRSASVIDLSDPAFFDVVDTMVVANRPLLRSASNPFLNNLRVDIDLDVERAFLRGEGLRGGQAINVEMTGQLDVTYDRFQNDFVLIGQLEAVRGTYSLYGRSFAVQGGTVEFVGTPGLNPNLDITAAVAAERSGDGPLQILATLQGTLANPRVELTSSEGRIAESDLVSYLIFGSPTYELAGGQRAAFATATGAGAGLLLGSLAQELGASLGSAFSADFISVRQTQGAALLQGDLIGSLAQSLIEAGWYLDDNLFLLLLLRPLDVVAQTSGSFFAGLRLEYDFAPQWTAEAFIEDRFLRSGTFGFGLSNFQVEQVYGLFVFREWGY